MEGKQELPANLLFREGKFLYDQPPWMWDIAHLRTRYIGIRDNMVPYGTIFDVMDTRQYETIRVLECATMRDNANATIRDNDHATIRDNAIQTIPDNALNNMRPYETTPSTI